MTKEDVLQKVKNYCAEKSYTSETLTDGFKDKFAEHFQKANPDGDINDDTILGNMKFALNAAFSSASDVITVKTTAFTSKENEWKRQIEELNRKIAAQSKPDETQQTVTLPDDIKNELEELKRFRKDEQRRQVFDRVLEEAKKNVREDLHGSLAEYAADFAIDADKDVVTQATALTERFKKIFKGTIGDIKPLAPRTKAHDAEFLASLPKIKV